MTSSVLPASRWGRSLNVVLQQITRLAGTLAFLVCFGGFSAQASAQRPNEAKRNPCLDGLVGMLASPALELPLGIILFNLDDGGLSEPRIATLSFDSSTKRSWLRILKCTDGQIQSAFALEEPAWEDWDELESFPSIHPSGVVIWGAQEQARSSLTIVIYTGGYTYLPSGERVEKKGDFKIAFSGYLAELVDLDLDGVPEVVSKMDGEMVEVWTLVEGTYVKVGAFPLARLRSTEVCNAIKAVRNKHVAPPPAHK